MRVFVQRMAARGIRKCCYILTVFCTFASVAAQNDVHVNCVSGPWREGSTVTIGCSLLKSSYPSKCVTSTSGELVFRRGETPGTYLDERCKLSDILNTCTSTGSCACGVDNATHYNFQYPLTVTDSAAGSWDCNVDCVDGPFNRLTKDRYECDDKTVVEKPCICHFGSDYRAADGTCWCCCGFRFRIGSSWLCILVWLIIALAIVAALYFTFFCIFVFVPACWCTKTGVLCYWCLLPLGRCFCKCFHNGKKRACFCCFCDPEKRTASGICDCNRRRKKRLRTCECCCILLDEDEEISIRTRIINFKEISNKTEFTAKIEDSESFKKHSGSIIEKTNDVAELTVHGENPKEVSKAIQELQKLIDDYTRSDDSKKSVTVDTPL